MRRASAFALLPVNSSGIPVGLPLVAYAGDDSNRTTADDGFVRRFVACQIANPCPAIGNCAGATFTAQGLAQWRIPLRPSERAGTIPASATGLRLFWSEQPLANRTAQVETKSPADFAYGYGFQPGLKVQNPPANGQYYVRGENINVQLSFKDGAGRFIPPVHCQLTASSYAVKWLRASNIMMVRD